MQPTRDPAPSFDRLIAACGLPRLEARVLLEQVSGRSREWLIAHGDESAAGAVGARFEALVRRRQDGEPIAYLVGRREFHGRDFEVGAEVLIPRPETEELVDLALASAEAGATRVLDLGTGSGCIAITLECLRPEWSVVATDRSRDALAIARRNAQRLCPRALTDGRLEFREGDWWAPLPPGERFDLIVSNPPYVADGDPHLRRGDLRFEPRSALASGSDGLAALRTICAGAGDRLQPGARLLVEHGFEQGHAVRALFAAVGLVEVRTLPDAAGLDRFTGGTMPFEV
jgi:release factor glutamine methyltransferase